jgi:hypothetical protein
MSRPGAGTGPHLAVAGRRNPTIPPQRSRPAGPAHRAAAAVTTVPTAQRETRYPRSGVPLPNCNVHLSSDVY